jgi:NTP pyrophosphatase (non-canonical NTP hydrolase)
MTDQFDETGTERERETSALNRRETYERAIDHWGEDAQLNMGVEEASELITALSRFLRGRTDEADVVEEVADVSIMVEQLAMIVGEDAVADVVDSKVARLSDRLDHIEAADE